MAQESCECRTQGHFIQARDPATMAATTVALLHSPERAQSLGRSARAQILANYSLESMLQRYHDVYVQHILAHKGSAA